MRYGDRRVTVNGRRYVESRSPLAELLDATTAARRRSCRHRYALPGFARRSVLVPRLPAVLESSRIGESFS